MNQIDASIVIPTRDRPALLARAVESALAQTHESLEVVVVDDGSAEPVERPKHPRAQVIRHPRARGSAAARNTGLAGARGPWVSFLDDDDCLLPHMIETSLEALARTTLPPPVGVLSGVELVDEQGRILERRFPPTCPRGTWFGVEAIPGFPPGPAYETKQTLVIERNVLLGIGGWIDGFQPRETTELFLRLSQVCSFVGVPVITYRQLRHLGPRLTTDIALRERGLERLIRRHRAVFEAHPEGYADFLRRHAHHLRVAGRWDKSLVTLIDALRLAPVTTARETLAAAGRKAVEAARGRG